MNNKTEFNLTTPPDEVPANAAKSQIGGFRRL